MGSAFPLPRSRSMRVTVPSTAVVNHTAPNAKATPLGALPTSIVPKTLLVPGSICETPHARARHPQGPPRRTRERTGRAHLDGPDLAGIRIDPGHGAIAPVCHPHRPGTDGGRTRPRPTANCSDSAPRLD